MNTIILTKFVACCQYQRTIYLPWSAFHLMNSLFPKERKIVNSKHKPKYHLLKILILKEIDLLTYYLGAKKSLNQLILYNESTYIISLVLSGVGRPFHPPVPSSVPSSKFLILGWKRRTTTTNGGRNNFIQMWSAELTREPVVVRSLGRCERWRPPVLAFPHPKKEH